MICHSVFYRMRLVLMEDQRQRNDQNVEYTYFVNSIYLCCSNFPTSPTLANKKSASSASRWYPKDLNSAKAVAFYNMSVIHAVRGEIDLAYRNFNLVRFQQLNFFFSTFLLLIRVFFVCRVSIFLKNNQPIHTS